MTGYAESARLKLERAVEHIDAVEALIEQWLDGDDYTIVSETDAGTGLTTARARVTAAPPARVGVLAGTPSRTCGRPSTTASTGSPRARWAS
jgi:hypothetical protein